MNTHYSKPTETGYQFPVKIKLPLILNNPYRQINIPTTVDLAELGELPAETPPTLIEGQKYGEPKLVDGVVVVETVAIPQIDLEAQKAAEREMNVVSMRQARLALLQTGKLALVEVAINSLPESPEKEAALIEWEYATEVRRLHGWVLSLQPALGLTDAELDDLFALAATL